MGARVCGGASRRGGRYDSIVTDATSADSHLLADQVAYYRDRAGEYDEWWFRTGRYDRGPEFNAAWFADVADVERALGGFLDLAQPARALELACGTGLFTRHLAPRVAHLTAVDASPEAIALNRARVARDDVVYLREDLFAWTPPGRYDLVFMSFWLSHVPLARFAAFWSMVGRALAPGGAAYVIDSALDPTSTARDHPRPDAASGVVTRKLNDGRAYRIVKIFHDPPALNARLDQLGFDARIAGTPRYFIHGCIRARA
jgi:demethylmenaquinone methyltransferase/2-methoxy-6-polyprenyl-1,4-benzoquinol methylase